jgi:hypothetical protein
VASSAAVRHLKRLIGRSERGRLTRDELAEYQALAQELQRLDAARAEATVELARRRGKSVRAVKAEIECHKYAKTQARDPKTGRTVPPDQPAPPAVVAPLCLEHRLLAPRTSMSAGSS